jgi:hypothetical protein
MMCGTSTYLFALKGWLTDPVTAHLETVKRMKSAQSPTHGQPSASPQRINGLLKLKSVFKS